MRRPGNVVTVIFRVRLGSNIAIGPRPESGHRGSVRQWTVGPDTRQRKGVPRRT